MNRNADEIRREIEFTRGQLAQNLEAIGDKVSPKHVVEQLSEKVSPRRILGRQTEKVRGSLSGAADSVLGMAGDTLDGVRTGASSVAGSAQGNLTGAAENATGTAAMTIDGVRQQASNLTDRVRSASTVAGDQLRAAPEASPLATAVVAFGAGLVAGLALPPNDKERQVAAGAREQAIEPLKQRATGTGRSVAGALQPAARAKAQRVKRTATGAAERVKSEGKRAARDVTGQAGGAAASVRAQAARAARTTQTQAKPLPRRRTAV